MKTDIHPDYTEASVRCSCGNTFTTRSTKSEIHLELCNECHPFFTGKQKLVDSGGRVERFQRRYATTGAQEASRGQTRGLIDPTTGRSVPAGPGSVGAERPAVRRVGDATLFPCPTTA